MTRVILLVASIVLVGCAATSKELSDNSEGTVLNSTVFYGTDRNVDDRNKPSRYYGLKRGVPEYGTARVTVDAQADKATLESVTPLARTVFLDELQAALDLRKTSTVMVFVHGYNRSFHQVSKLAAEFSTATDFAGVTLMWSWPSSRNPAGYLEDESNMRWSQPHLRQFLIEIFSHSGVETVHLVGHSMGARGLTDVLLRDLIPAGLDVSKVGEYVLLAPDIDKAIFERDLAPQLLSAGMHTTLYASSNDKALASAYGLRRYPRAGDSSFGPTISVGVETIDVTVANKSILGHSYFEESSDVSDDLAELLNNRSSAVDREQLEYIEVSNGGYWRLQVE